MRFRSLVSLLVFALLLSGCSSLVDNDQGSAVPECQLVLEPGQTVGQTLVARHGGLAGVDLWLAPHEGAQGELILHLRSAPDLGTGSELAQSLRSGESLAASGFQRFSFSPIQASHGESYYAFLEYQGTGVLQVGCAGGDSYQDGAAYQSHAPLDAQLAFRLTYAAEGVLRDLVAAAIQGAGLLLLALVVFALPGYALLAWLWRGGHLPWLSRLGLAVGLSVAIYPLLFLWADLLGIHLGALYAWLPIVAGALALLWRHRAWRPRQGWDALRRWLSSPAFLPDLAAVLVLLLVFVTRLLVVRTLDAPLWGDSYQHTMIAQLLLDNRGLFSSWAPYAELQTLTYHFGFHSMVAVYSWVTGAAAPQSTIWVGQLLNALAVVVLYSYVFHMSKRRWAGVAALLVAGLLLPMPMVYVNWGRYTQLAGQVILPVAMLLSAKALVAAKRDWRAVILTWIAVGGLSLTHFRVLVFYGIFVVAWALVSLRKVGLRHAIARVALLGSGSALLFLPWFVRTWGGGILSNFQRQVTTMPSQLDTWTRQYNAIGDITSYMTMPLWLLLFLALGVGLWRRRSEVLLIAVWMGLLLLATNPHWLDLPGSGAISNFAIFIAVYIPAGLLLGSWVVELPDRFYASRWVQAVLLLCVIALGGVGFRSRLSDLQLRLHQLVTRPDVQAMSWIAENTSADARFLVNSFFAYGGTSIVGSDGGWWLPLLANRSSTLPPLNYGTEQGPYPEYVSWINELAAQLIEHGTDDPASLEMLRRHGVTHVYVGQRQGVVNSGGVVMLDPEALAASPHYTLLYHRDRVWIFELAQ